MIHYDLRCGGGHEFDGWFKDMAAFDMQSARHLLECPICGATTVTRAIMSPRLSRGVPPPKPANAASETPGKPASPAAASSGVPVPRDDKAAHGGAPVLPDEVRALLQRVRAEVESKCDYVGPSFADEARRIHNGEVPGRAIYGETTPEQAEALADDGIEVARIPWLPRADS